jgi:hypothetical protein
VLRSPALHAGYILGVVCAAGPLLSAVRPVRFKAPLGEEPLTHRRPRGRELPRLGRAASVKLTLHQVSSIGPDLRVFFLTKERDEGSAKGLLVGSQCSVREIAPLGSIQTVAKQVGLQDLPGSSRDVWVVRPTLSELWALVAPVGASSGYPDLAAMNRAPASRSALG